MNIGRDGNLGAPIRRVAEAAATRVALLAFITVMAAGAGIGSWVTPAAAQTVIYSESFDGAWTTPWTLYTNGWPWSGEGFGDTEWHRNDWTYGWSDTSGSYSPPAVGGYSARFNSTGASPGSSGSMITSYVDLSTCTLTKTLHFWYVNTSGPDSLYVSMSEDAGGTFPIELISLGLTSVWTEINVPLPSSSAMWSKFKFRAVADGGASDIGIDEISITCGTVIAGGTYEVGDDQPELKKLTDVANRLNGAILTGDVIFELNSTYDGTNDFPTFVPDTSSASPWTVTIRPKTGVSSVTTSGSSSSAVIRLDGADRFTLDGRPGGVGSTGVWTVRNTSTAGGTAAIWLSSRGAGQGASDNTVRHLALACGADQSAVAVENFAIISSGAAISTASDGADNDRNTFSSNTIKRARHGVYLRGAAGNSNDGSEVSGNVVGPAAFGSDQMGRTGIVLQHQNDASVTQNDVGNIGVRVGQAPGGSDRAGIALGTSFWVAAATPVTNTRVSRNRVHDIVDEKTFSAVGILVAGSGAPSSNVIDNNLVFGVRANGTAGDQGVGIGISAGSGDLVPYNSIRLSGDADPTGAASTTHGMAGIRIASAGVTNLTLENNISSVDVTSNTGTVRHFSIIAPSAAYAWGTGVSNHNDLDANPANPQAALGGIGTGPSYTAYTSLAAWRGVFTPAQDGNTINVRAPYVSETDLDLQIGPPTSIESGGTPIPGVTYAYDGLSRLVTAHPDIGAYERNLVRGRDLSAGALIEPPPGSSVPGCSLFVPRASFTSSGDTVVTAAQVRFRISASGGGVLYDDVETIASLGSGATTTVSFAPATLSASGTHTMTATAELVDDGVADNDSVNGSLGVDPCNVPPVIEEMHERIAQRGQTIVFKALAVDFTCLPLAWSILDGPPGTTIDAQSGEVSVPVAECDAEGPQTLALEVVDDCDLADTTYTVVHVRSGRPPECITPLISQPKLQNWSADPNDNFVEGILESPGAGAGKIVVHPSPDSVVSLVYFSDCIEEGGPEFAALDTCGVRIHRYRYVSMALYHLARAKLDTVARFPWVAMVAADHLVKAALDTSVRVLRVRSSEYSPHTMEDRYEDIDGGGTAIAFLDSGIDDGLHETLPSEAFLAGFQFNFGTAVGIPANPIDVYGHGTFVASIAVGRADGSGNHRGIAPRARIVDIQTLDASGVGTESDQIAAIEMCRDSALVWNLAAINIAGVMDTYDPALPWVGDDAYSQAVNDAVSNGIVVVVPAGNKGPANTTLLPPATADLALTVGATAHQGTVNRDDDQVAEFSERGPRADDADVIADEFKPEVVAPGTDLSPGGTGIVSAQAGTVNGYVAMEGTSAAAAHVSGVVALLRSRAWFDPAVIEDILTATATQPIPPPGPSAAPPSRPGLLAAFWDPASGFGQVDAFAACSLHFAPTADLGFDYYERKPHLEGEPYWFYSPDVAPENPIITHSVPNTVLVKVKNYGPNDAWDFHVTCAEWPEGSSHRAYTFGDVIVTDTLAAGDSLTLEFEWIPGSHHRKKWIHSCLKAAVFYRGDRSPINNRAQHNVDYSGSHNTGPGAGIPDDEARAGAGIAASSATEPGLRFNVYVANLTGQSSTVYVDPFVLSGTGWTVQLADTAADLEGESLAIPMSATAVPRNVIVDLIPGPAADDTVRVIVDVSGTTTCGVEDLGGCQVVGLLTRLTGVPSAVVTTPRLLLAPMPFRNDLRIAFRLSRREEDVRILVHDTQGRAVRTLALGPREAGEVSTTWDGRTRTGQPAAPGVYFVSVRSRSLQATGRVVLRR